MKEWAFLEGPTPSAFAHRGGDDAAPENSMAAFERAVAMGFRYLETDVHLSADGRLIAFHDDRLDRVTDSCGMVRDLTWAEISEARIGGQEPIPLFDELLHAWPEARINIEPKSDESVDPLVEAIRDAGAIDRVCIGSFSDKRIARCQEALGPDLCTSPGPRGIAAVLARSLYLPVPCPPVGCLQVPAHVRGVRLVTSRLVRRAHAMGLQVHVWTVNTAEEMIELLDMGVDALMTDKLELLVSVMEARGEWPS